MSDEISVFTFPQPTVNGPLHVGHLSGPYLAADLAARAARARGEHVLVTSGLDVHQNYVLARAENEGLDPQAMTKDFRDDILETYDRARIGYDRFTDPLEDSHAPVIRQLLNHLVDSGAAPLREITMYTCGDCNRTLHDAYLSGRCGECEGPAAGGACEVCGTFNHVEIMIDPCCGRCGGEPRPFQVTVPVLRLEDYRASLTETWIRAELPPEVRGLVERIRRAGLPEIPLAFPTDWGIECDGALTGLRVGAYTEVALTDLYGIARAVDPEAADVAGYLHAIGRVSRLWHFLGLDNAFAYAVHWPAVWAAAGIDRSPLAGLVVNEFYTFEGAKFSTSRNHGITASELLRTCDPSIVRLFLAWDRPDRFQSDFVQHSFDAFAEYAEPLLAGVRQASEPLDPALAAIELARGEAALRPSGFDPPLAARCLLTLLAGGVHNTGSLRAVLTGLG
ncbi:methionine--tRNA ligase [Kribbella antibiotica]|uniref:Methionine--tRNA ligase n=1 Tax=Kribbella antibiotica TaxID=190195 RepID=A0A4R4Z6L1_9ACTN|nr:class I tRNA ligase family protein [Kribbella antibiotica]TDD53755.1 methionine--tRNA ligase [Kribbella antibiotica]